MEQSYVVTQARFHRLDPNIYILQGYFQGNSIAGNRMSASLGRRGLDLEVKMREGLVVRQKYFSMGIGYENIDREYDLLITLPEQAADGEVLRIWQENDGKRRCIWSVRWKRLMKDKTRPDSYLEMYREEEGRICIGGWAVGSSPCRIQVTAGGKRLESELTRLYRPDILDGYPELSREHDPEDEELKYGFEIRFEKPKALSVQLIIAADGQRDTCRISLRRGLSGMGGKLSLPKRGWAYLRRNGLRRTVRRAIQKIRLRLTGREETYMAWKKRHDPSKEELQTQARSTFLDPPLISVVVPLYKTRPDYLQALVDSVLAQSYANWELCLSDGSGSPSPLQEALDKISARDSRIHVIRHEQPLGISENTNEAIGIASGSYIAFADHDDLLAPDALYECACCIRENPQAGLIYSDEDKVSEDGREYFEPHFKTDYNIDLLCSMNYICHLTVIARPLLDECGLLDPFCDGAQDHDLILRCAEKAEQVCHIPKVLYHWRTHRESTSENPASKMYAFEAGVRAVQAHYDRIGVAAAVSMGPYPGLYRTTYKVPDPAPMISIIIPNKDHVPDLEVCLDSILQQSSYPDYEIIIVENNSDQEATFAYYREMQERDARVRVITWKGEFNYSLINNFGAEAACGDYLLFLNNDTKMIHEDTLAELVGPCLREDVGITGARLYYGDDTIQHAGVILGYGGIAGHAFGGFDRRENGYFSRIICQSDLSAVTAACLMIRRTVFEEAGGFDGELKVAFNDVDLCLKVRQAGYLVVYNPYAELYHFESRSRGAEDTPGKISRFNSEADLLLKRWSDVLSAGDPYYNPNLSLDSNDFRLKR